MLAGTAVSTIAAEVTRSRYITSKERGRRGERRIGVGHVDQGRREIQRLTKDSRLREINDRRAVQRTEDTAVGDGEGTTGHVFDSQFTIPCLKNPILVYKIHGGANSS